MVVAAIESITRERELTGVGWWWGSGGGGGILNQEESGWVLAPAVLKTDTLPQGDPGGGQGGGGGGGDKC